MAGRPGWEALQAAGRDAGWRNTFHSRIEAELCNLEGVLEQSDDPYPGGWVCSRNVGGVSEEKIAYVHPTSGVIINYQTPARLEIRLAKEGDDPRWWIIGVVSSKGQTALNGKSLIHQFVEGLQYPVGANFMDFRVMPSAGKVVRVEAGVYRVASTGKWARWNGGEYDLTDEIGALTSGQHQMVLIGLDTEAGTLTTVTSTAETGSDKQVWSGTLGDLDVPARVLPCGAVWIYQGQATIEDSHIYRGPDEARAFMQTAGVRVRVSSANVSNPPTDAELDGAFGSPSAVGAGFVAVIDDNGAGTNGYVVWSDGTNWWYTTGTKAV